MVQRRPPSNNRGTAAVELALTFPLLLLILMGLWEVGRLVEVRQLVSGAAREAGRQASTGSKSAAEVQADAINYLQKAGLNTNGTTVTFTNVTNSQCTDPSDADQLDELQVTVSLPFNNVRWIFLQQITNASTISATSNWNSMKDVPVTVPVSIPVE
jgi:Flp pilus assembly protein TadG